MLPFSYKFSLVESIEYAKNKNKRQLKNLHLPVQIHSIYITSLHDMSFGDDKSQRICGHF